MTCPLACSLLENERCSVNEKMNKATKAGGVRMALGQAAFKNEPSSKAKLMAQVLSSYILAPRLNPGPFPEHLFTPRLDDMTSKDCQFRKRFTRRRVFQKRQELSWGRDGGGEIRSGEHKTRTGKGPGLGSPDRDTRA